MSTQLQHSTQSTKAAPTAPEEDKGAVGQLEQPLETIIEIINDAIIIYRLNGRFLTCNQSAIQLLGYSRQELSTLTPEQIVHPDDHGLLRRKLQILQTGQSVQIETIHVNKNGKTIPVEVSASPFSYQEEQAIFIIIYDITARKRAESELHLDQERFKALYRLSQMMDDSEKNIKDFALEAGVQMTKSRIGYIYFMNEDETRLTLHAWSNTVMEQCRVVDKRTEYLVSETGLWGEAVRRRRPVITNDYAAPHPKKRGAPPGHVPITRHVNIPLIDNGKIVLIAGVGNKEDPYSENDVQQLTLIMDAMWRIIQKKRGQAQLIESEARFRTMADTAPVLVWMSDRTKKCTFFNKTWLRFTGRTLAQERGDGWTENLHPDDMEFCLATYNAAFDERRPFEMEYRLRRADGQYRWVIDHGVPRFEPNGAFAGYIGSCTDITERKKMEKQIKQMNQMLEQRVQERTGKLMQMNIDLQNAMEAAQSANVAKSTFLANMSHELRTPLNAILGFTQLLRRSPNLTAVQKENLSIVEQSGGHLLDLINDVLEMSKIEAGQVTLKRTNFDLYQLLSTLGRMFSIRANSKGIELRLSILPGVPQFIHADERKLRQILINLLNNAVKFTQQGKITLEVKLRSSYPEANDLLHFAVSDTGPGIPPEEMHKLFQPFTQTTLGQQTEEGSGLGLPISRRFVQLMGGDLHVSSRPDEGATFYFSIPYTAVYLDQSSPTESNRYILHLDTKQIDYRILVVEDNEAGRELLVQLMQSLNFQVQAAGNGQEAIDAWQAWRPHLILMDMRMPVLDGYKATQKIRALSEKESPIIIAVTASAFEHHKKLILAIGCDDYIRKPYQEAEVLEKIARHLNLSFSYEVAPEPATAVSHTPPALSPADLARLPAPWRAALNRAATRGKSRQILTLLNQIRPQHPNLAAALSTLVDHFRFDILVNLTQTDETPHAAAPQPSHDKQ